MVDKNGNEVKVGDKVHYFGVYDMRPVGVVVGFTTSESGEEIALINHVTATRQEYQPYHRFSRAIELVSKR